MPTPPPAPPPPPPPAAKKRKLSQASDRAARPSKKASSASAKAAVSAPTTQKSTTTTTDGTDTASRILALEEAIAESPKNYNSLLTLLDLFRASSERILAGVALCRTFCRLLAGGKLGKRKGDSEAEAKVAAWLKDRYKEYVAELCRWIRSPSSPSSSSPSSSSGGEEEEDDNMGAQQQNTAVALMMRLVKEEATHTGPPDDDYYFPHDTFAKVVAAMAAAGSLDEQLREDLLKKYLNAYDDVRYSFLVAVTRIATECLNSGTPSVDDVDRNILPLLLELRNVPTADSEAPHTFYAVTIPSKPKSKSKAALLSLSSHRKAAQECWLSVLRLRLPPATRKQVLTITSSRIAPSFPKPQLLMDFLTSCYDAGGSSSLLALSGLFHLISTKNLDYPSFYPKLYSLLTRDVLHVRYRSRFLRHLSTFLASTHLPAALVASFVKKLARLALCAPPAAVVAVVPLVYNLLQTHASCTFMLHRVGCAEQRARWRSHGCPDPFVDAEPDPMRTRAVESSLWELETLQTHWHPNVATLCRILGEQFTKERYNLEDFLDHGYGSMFESDATKPLKKPPVVEFAVPRRIFFPLPAAAVSAQTSPNPNPNPNPLLELWSFS